LNLNLHLSEMKLKSKMKFRFYCIGVQTGSLIGDLMEEFKFVESNSFHGCEKIYFDENKLMNIEELTIKLVIESIELIQ
jgi:hypothetical protein